MPALVKLLKEGDGSVELNAEQCLRMVGPDPRNSEQFLIFNVSDTNGTSAYTFGELAHDHRRLDLLVAALAKNLADSNKVWLSLNALESLETDARPAVPQLLELLTNNDETIRPAATNALKSIDPEAAAKAGVK